MPRLDRRAGPRVIHRENRIRWVSRGRLPKCRTTVCPTIRWYGTPASRKATEEKYSVMPRLDRGIHPALIQMGLRVVRQERIASLPVRLPPWGTPASTLANGNE